MTNRQWAFYRYLKEQNEIDPNRWISKEEIYWGTLGLKGVDYRLNESPKVHDICSTMNADMEAINNDEVIEKLVILNDNHFKIATELEALEYIEKLEERARKISIRKNRLVYKFKKHGQYKLLSNKNVPIDESSGREYVEAFIE